ncbi:DUF4214 domain-containing protein [Rhizobium sp. LjRoot30]|uniref:DUF4214 domain-containing protein n=1 Tax=Rhizobium sp. LjRoot30 TaxID=3342320 RepID=UPI003ECD8CF2
MATIQGIYVALFGRPADPAGLAFFNEATNNGADLTAIGDLASTTEYQARFTGMTNEQIVNSIYQSLFERDGEAAGVDFYVGELEAGRLTINNIAIAILDGAQNDDLTTVNAKIAAANIFTTHLDQQVEIDAYAGDDAAAIGRTFIDGVTKDDAGTEAEADAAILLLLGQGGQDPDGGDGDGAGNPGGIISEISLHQGLTLAELPAQYTLAVGATAEDLGDISVADYGKIAGIIAGAENAADYSAVGYLFEVSDSFANIEADSSFLTDAGLNTAGGTQSGYSITDATLDLTLDTDDATLLHGADNFDAGLHDYDIVDDFADFATLDAAVYTDADYVTVNGSGDPDVITGLGARNGLTINGGAGADVITSPSGGPGGEDDHIFDGGAGVDTINLAVNVGDDIIVLATSNANRDIINNFETGFDDLRVADANVTADISGGIASGQFESFTATPNGFLNFGNFNLASRTTSADAIVEFNNNFSSAFDATVTGADMLDALNDSILPTSAAGIAVGTAGWAGYLIAYADNNAYVFYANDANSNSTLAEGEIQLAATITGVAAGGLGVSNFVNDGMAVI